MADRRLTINARARRTAQVAETVLAALRRGGCLRVTAPEASALSGVPLYEAEPALLDLAGRYPCDLSVSEAGQIAFAFETLDRGLEPGALGRAARAVAGWAARHRDRILAALTLAVLPYVAVAAAGNAVALAVAVGPASWGLPALLLAGGVGGLGFVAWLGYQVLPLLAAALALAGPAVLVAGLLDGNVAVALGIGLPAMAGGLWGAWKVGPAAVDGWREALAGEGHAWSRRMWRRVGAALLGPPRPAEDPREERRRVAALAARQEGVLTLADLVGRFGWSVQEADRRLTRLLLDHGGDVLLTEEGAILFELPPLREAGAALALEAPEPAWAGEREPPALVGAEGRGAASTLVAAAAVAVAGLAAHPRVDLFPLPWSWRADDWPEWWYQGLGAWPFALLALPVLLRLPGWLRRRRAFPARRRFLDLAEVADTRPEGAWVADPDTRALAALHGDIDADAGTDDAGRVRVVFEDVARAKREAARVRRARREGVPVVDAMEG